MESNRKAMPAICLHWPWIETVAYLINADVSRTGVR